MSAEQLERVRSRDAESKREHRAQKKIVESLKEDAQQLLERKLRRAQSKIIALEHRIAYLEEILLAGDALPVSPAVADDVAVDDDGDDDDDESVASTGGWDASEPQGVYDYVHKSERRFRAQVGVGLTDFDELLVDVLPFLKMTSFEGEIVKKTKEEDVHKLPDRLQLFCTLYYLRHYPILRVAASYCRVPVMYLKKVLVRCINALSRAAEQLDRAKGGLGWPTASELGTIRASQSDVRLENLTPDFSIDGMHLRIRDPNMLDPAAKKPYWNGKHKCWCVMVIVVTDLRGRPVYVSDAFPGGEWQAVQSLDIKALCKNIGASIVGDALYAFNRATDKVADNIASYFTLGPKTVTRLRLFAGDDSIDAAVREQAKSDLRSTKAASRLRVVVENTIARMRHWSALTRNGAFRHYVPLAEKRPHYYIDIVHVARACVFLSSRQMQKSAPRGEVWVPNDDGGSAKYGYYGEPLNARNVERRVMALFKQLKPKKKAVVDGDDEEDESVSFDDGNVDGGVDWTRYEEKDDFLVMPVRATTARQKAIVANSDNAVDPERVRVGYDALDNAERKRTTTARFSKKK